MSGKNNSEMPSFRRNGYHDKKCNICGMNFKESNDLDELLITGPAQCPYCKPIIELENELTHHWHKFLAREDNDPVEDKNMVLDEHMNGLYKNGVVSYTLDSYEKSFEIIGRTNRVKDFIKRVKKARDYIYTSIQPYMRILESFYERKDAFWIEGGNLHNYVLQSVVQYIVINLKEYINADNYDSIKKIRNIIESDKKYLFEKHRIIEVKKFQKSGDVMRTEYPHFEIDKYLEKLDNVLESYSKTIDAIIDYRNTQFAHIGELKTPIDSEKELTFVNVKRIFNAIRIIYDGFYYSIAPDLYATIADYDYNFWFEHLNDISELWHDYETKNKNKY